MPARKTKKSSVKRVPRTKKSSSGLGPVHFIMVGVTAAVLLAGFLFYQQNIQSPTSPKNELKQTLSIDKSELDKKMVPDSGDEIVAEEDGAMILGAVGNFKQSGTISIDDVDGAAVVSIRLLGSTEAKQSAHIHYGSCTYPGEVKYPLVDLVDGSSKTTLEVTKQQLLWGLPLALMVHASTTDETVVACADLSY